MSRLDLEKAFCNSLGCREEFPKTAYCFECSHANFVGEAEVAGKTFKWTLAPYYGLEFIGKRGGYIKPPGPRHAVWGIIDVWLKDIARAHRTARKLDKSKEKSR